MHVSLPYAALANPVSVSPLVSKPGLQASSRGSPSPYEDLTPSTLHLF